MSLNRGLGLPLRGAFLSAALAWQTPAFAAQPPTENATFRHALWANASALTVRPQRLEGALLGRWTWGIHERVELRSHPVFSILVPALEAKVQLWNNMQLSDGAELFLSSRHQVSTPTPFLRLSSKEGAFGLLPAATDVPWTFLVENALLLTLRATEEHWITVQAGGVLAVPGASSAPLLDFPFLYQRYAALSAGATLFCGLALNGTFAGNLFSYSLESQLFALPLPMPGVQLAWENSLAVSWMPSDSQRVEVNVRAAVAEFPIGVRLHWFPGIDYGWAW